MLTLEGRTIVPVIMGEYQSERFNGKHGQSDLVKRKDGKWFLLVTVAPDVRRSLRPISSEWISAS